MSITREQAATWFETMHPPGPAAREMYRMAAKALRPVSRERIEKAWKGEWAPKMNCFSVSDYHKCSKCGEIAETVETGDEQLSDFCPFCGVPMSDKAVDMVMERLEALNEKD